MNSELLEKLRGQATEGAADVLQEILGESREDVIGIAKRVVSAGLRAVIEGDPQAHQIIKEQLLALANVSKIRANRALLDQAAAILNIVLTSIITAALSAL